VIQCAVFDIDDTLYLERDYVHSGFKAVGAWAESEWGVVGFAAAAWALFLSGRRGNVFDLTLAALGRSDLEAQVTAMVACYREHTPDITLLPDAAETLEWLRPHVPLAAITDGPAASQQRKAHALGLVGPLDPIVCTAELGPGHSKPSPVAFVLVQDALAASGSQCLYVADNPAKDFAGPKALGWLTVRVRREGSLHESVRSGDDVDHEGPSLAALRGILEAHIERQ